MQTKKAAMKILRNTSLLFSILSLIIFVIVYFGTDHMQEVGNYDIGSGIWVLGEAVRGSAVLGAVLAVPGLIKRDQFAPFALGMCLFAFGLLYGTGWHSFVHHGV